MLKPSHLILKVASRCNIACTYCHWFRDPEVLNLPKKINSSFISEFQSKLEHLISEFEIQKFSIVLHGGEPLLLGRETTSNLCESINEIKEKTNCNISIGLTTNGLLIDEEWCSLFNKYNIDICVSIDGPKEVHDTYRVDFSGKGTFDNLMLKCQILKRFYKKGLNVLTVANPKKNADSLLQFFIEDLEVKSVDFLIPNFNHDDKENLTIPSISNFYCDLFDSWYNKYSKSKVVVRCIEAFVSSILNRQANLSGVGFSPMTTISILPNGDIEPHDALRISGADQTNTNVNLYKNDIQEILNDPTWVEAYRASINLPDDCMSCKYKNVCGGGYLIHRYSHKKRYNNPSIYCKDLKVIYSHIYKRLISDLYVINSESLPTTMCISNSGFLSHKTKVSAYNKGQFKTEI